MKRNNKTSVLRLLACSAVVALAGVASAEELAGTWALESYEMMGEEQKDVSGLLIMTDSRFAMVYTMNMDGDGLSGRAHAGHYESRGDELTFDVEQWVQHVNGEGRVVPPEQVSAETTVEGGTLVLRFGSGSVQRWKRLSGGMANVSAGGGDEDGAAEPQLGQAASGTPATQR